MENKPEWMNDPLVQHIEEKKLAFLSELVFGGKGKTQKEMMPFMMMKMKQAKAEHISFSPAEVTAVVEAIKRHSSPEEKQQIDQILKKAGSR